MTSEEITWKKASLHAGLLVLMGSVIGWSISMYVQNQALAAAVEDDNALFYDGNSVGIAQVLNDYCDSRVYAYENSNIENWNDYYSDGKLAVYTTSEGEDKLMLWCESPSGGATGDYLIEE